MVEIDALSYELEALICTYQSHVAILSEGVPRLALCVIHCCVLAALAHTYNNYLRLAVTSKAYWCTYLFTFAYAALVTA